MASAGLVAGSQMAYKAAARYAKTPQGKRQIKKVKKMAQKEGMKIAKKLGNQIVKKLKKV